MSGLSHYCIERPIFAAVLSILLTIIGAVAYTSLPVAQYPEIAPPTIQVTTSYPGASAEVVADTVAAPLEQEINGVENMLYMQSQATGDGQLTITVTFALGTDLDIAQVLVQNRAAIAQPRLPEEVRQIGVTVRKNSPDFLMVIHLLSPDDSRDEIYLSNYATLQIRDVLSRIVGVGDVRVFGTRDYAMRIWIDPEKASSRAITAGDITAALRGQNTQVASGVLNQPPIRAQGAFQQNVETLGRLEDVREFEDIVVKTDGDGRVTRIRDIARVELGARSYDATSFLDDMTAVAMIVTQLPGTNALAAAAELKTAMQRLKADFPPGVDYRIIYNPTEFIEFSIEEVYKAIIEAVALVVVVVILFLQTWRASIIPIVAIPVSLVGTFAAMAALGFSINNLSLFGLVLAVGIVVDDAIVVVENVERRLGEGMTPKAAAHATMDEVGGALVAIALVLAAVFVPAAFITGIQGQFFRQFAVTIAVATAISCFVSLTLSPALCALLLRPHAEHGEAPMILRPITAFFALFNRGFEALGRGYARLARSLIRVSVLVLVVYGGLIGLTAFQFLRAPTGFIPEQDQGYLINIIQLPPGSSLARTEEVVKAASRIILDTPGIAYAVAFAGFDPANSVNASNAGAIFAGMDPFEERRDRAKSAPALVAELQKRLSVLQEALILTISPPPVRGIGTGGGFKMMVQDRRGRGLAAVEEAARELIGQANRQPEVARVFSLFNTSTPKIYADIDRVKAEILNVRPERVFETLEVYLGSSYVNDFNYLGRTYRVTLQADAPFRQEIDDIAELKTRSDTGAMVPLGSVATFNDLSGPYRVTRYNLYPAAEVQGSTPQGVSTGQSLATMERLAREVLPDGLAFEWTELALQEKLTGNTSIFVFIASVVFVFLLLAALYESWLLPLAVVLIVPMCILAGVSGILWRGQDVNILAQIGFVVLVGLAAKNAILIVEFARQREAEGADRIEAALDAARTRLRPILMTSFAFILGVVPLVIASGAGAEMRRSLGTAVFSGMLGVTAFGLLFTPVFYVVCRALARKPAGPHPAPGPAASPAPAE